MTHFFDTAEVADRYGIPSSELGVSLVAHRLDAHDYESVLIFDRRRTAPAVGVLSVPNFMGIRQQALEIAAKTIGPAYPIFVADVFGKSGRPTSPEQAMHIIAPLKENREELRKRMNAALDAFRAQSAVRLTDVVACGFCFGGTAALELARSGADLKAFASLHGGLDSLTPADAHKILGSILVLHGAQDPSVPREQVDAFVDEMSNAQVDWQLLIFGQAGHSFTDPEARRPGFFYHAPTALRSSIALRAFFADRAG